MEHPDQKTKAAAASDDRHGEIGLILASLVVVFAMIGIVLAGLSGLVLVTQMVVAFAAGYLLRQSRR